MEKYFFRLVDWIIYRYHKLEFYLFWGEMRKKHILIQKDGGQIKIVVKDHAQFVAEKQEIIDAYRYKNNEEKYIRFALK